MDDATEQHDGVEQQAAAVLEAALVAGGASTVEHLAAVLTAEHPQLADALVASRPGVDLEALITELARHSDAFWRLPDGRLAPVLHHLRRAVFTHRISADERTRDALDVCPDLLALALPRTFVLADGTTVRSAGSNDDPRAADEGSLLGPAGWLQAFPVGSLVAVRYDGEQVGLIALDEAVVDATAGEATASALAAAFAAIDPAPTAPEVHRLVVDAIGTHPAAFAVTTAPVTELLATAGLRVREVWVGAAGAEWATPAEQARRRRLDELLAGADGCCQRAARRSLDAWQAWMDHAGPGLTTADATRMVEDLDHGPVAGVLAETATLGRPLVSVRRLGRWADAVAAASGSVTAGGCYLRALGADASGDAPAAEDLLHAGLAAEADHPACLGMLAELQQDRGDAAAAMALLQRTGRPVHPEALAELSPFLVRRDVGRNEPCPCGSGRKFKACCAITPKARPLPERCRWLLAKATRHAIRTDPLALQSLRHLFETSYGGGDAMALAGDMLLFANGGLARYLTSRGALLPTDELACARDWLTQPMRVLRIGTTGPDGLLAAVDVVTGADLAVDDRHAASTLTEGEAVLTRALPVGDTALLTSAVLRVPEASLERAVALVGDEVRPIALLQFLVDLQVDALRR